jgi:MFS family permease
LAFALRRTSEPAWMYAAAIGAYGVGTYAGNSVAPLMRRRFGEDRLTAGALAALAIMLAFSALGPSRPIVLLVSLVLGGVAAVARQGFDAMVQTHAPMATRARSFARFETRFQLGWVAGAVAATAIAIPIRYSLVVLAVFLLPAAALYMNALREGHAAHVDDPFDPVEVARRRIDHAVEWHRRELDRLAVTELAGVVDLARATGLVVSTDEIIRLDALRAAAMSTWPLDTREVDWAMDHAATLVDRLADGSDPPPIAVAEDEPDEQDDPAPPEEDQDSSGATTDSDVTAHCDDCLPIVSTTLDESTSER